MFVVVYEWSNMLLGFTSIKYFNENFRFRMTTLYNLLNKMTIFNNYLKKSN